VTVSAITNSYTLIARKLCLCYQSFIDQNGPRQRNSCYLPGRLRGRKKMNRVTHLVALILLALSSANASHATTIQFLPETGGTLFEIKNDKPISIPLLSGMFNGPFINKTGETIKDFHFEWKNNQADVIGEDNVLKAFGSFTATMTTLNFFNAPGGMDILNNGKFSIFLSGFDKNTTVMANVTFSGGKGTNSTKSPYGKLPKPGSFVLLGTALVGLLGVSRLHRKQSRSFPHDSSRRRGGCNS
jgi:hypothetical protein